jgi:hypothetical protein
MGALRHLPQREAAACQTGLAPRGAARVDRAMSNAVTISGSGSILFEGNANYAKGKLRYVLGRLQVSPTELTFFKKPWWAYAFGLLGALLARNAKGKALFTIALTDVHGVEVSKFGPRGKILVVTVASGGSYRIIVDKLDALLAVLPPLVGERFSNAA